MPRMAPYCVAGNQREESFTSPVQPMLWTLRFAIQATVKSGSVPDAAKPIVQSTDSVMPPRKARRPPARSASGPLANFPRAYASTPSDAISPSRTRAAEGSIPCAASSSARSGSATAKLERQR